MYLCKGYRVRLFLDIGNVPTMWYFVLFLFYFCFHIFDVYVLPSCSHVHIANQNTYSYEQTTNEALVV